MLYLYLFSETVGMCVILYTYFSPRTAICVLFPLKSVNTVALRRYGNIYLFVWAPKSAQQQQHWLNQWCEFRGGTICFDQPIANGGVFRETCLKTGMIFAVPSGDGSGVENRA